MTARGSVGLHRGLYIAPRGLSLCPCGCLVLVESLVDVRDVARNAVVRVLAPFGVAVLRLVASEANWAFWAASLATSIALVASDPKT